MHLNTILGDYRRKINELVDKINAGIPPGLHASKHLSGGDDPINHDNLEGYSASKHLELPNTIVNVLSDENTLARITRKLDDFGVPDDNTDLNASTTRHGLLKKLGGGTINFLRADGTWIAVTVLGSGAVAVDHGVPATDMLVNVCYGTGDPPTANTTTIGTLFVKYTP